MAFIVALIAFLADFLPVVFMGDQLDAAISGDVHSTVQTLYVCDETEYGFDFSALSEVGITCNKVTTAEADSKIAELANSNENAMVSRIRMEEKTLFVTSCYPGGEETVVKKGDCESINSALANIVSVQYLMHYGVPESEVPTAMAGVHTELSAAGEEPVSMVQQILNAVIFSYSQLVAQAVAIEKSSRIIEYLLTSIKPLAIIIGKVLAMCCVSLLQFFIIGFCGTLGFLISLPFGIFTKVQDIAAAAGSAAAASGSDAVNIVNDIGAAFSGVDASVILIMIVTFILGFLLYAGLAGLAGASISKMEDLSSAIQPLSLIGVLGFYLAYFPQVVGEENAMSQLARYLPISSPFILSSDYLLGKISIVECLISVAILAAADVLVMMFVAKVYETIILHTGNKLSVGDIIHVVASAGILT